MSTVIICPACKSRYEIKAAFPPEGRKVRCTKCGNVWQATAVVEGPRVAAQPAGAPPAPKPPAAPRAPAAPAAAAPRPPVAPPRPPVAPPRAPVAAPQAPTVSRPSAPVPPAAPTAPGMGVSTPSAVGARQPNGGATAARAPARGASDASFDVGEDFEADLANAVAGNTPGFWPGAQGPAGADTSQDLGSYHSGALVNPALPQSSIPIRGERKTPKVPPKVAMGWGLLALFLAILAALVTLAPKTVTSILPGAARLYGNSAASRPLDIRGVNYEWADATGTQVLRVQGQVVNLTGAETPVPPVVISLQDASGNELSAVTATLAPVGPGASSTFVAEIPAPPPTLQGLKVRFAKAG